MCSKQKYTKRDSPCVGGGRPVRRLRRPTLIWGRLSRRRRWREAGRPAGVENTLEDTSLGAGYGALSPCCQLITYSSRAWPKCGSW
ncbi:unnamed protein product, partial [Iphiclides podalirius]